MRVYNGFIQVLSIVIVIASLIVGGGIVGISKYQENKKQKAGYIKIAEELEEQRLNEIKRQREELDNAKKEIDNLKEQSLKEKRVVALTIPKESPAPIIIATPTPTSTPTPKLTPITTPINNEKCEELKKEFDSFYNEIQFIWSQISETTNSFLEMFDMSNDLSYGHQRIKEKKDTFLNRINKIENLTNDLKNLSFLSILEIKNTLYDYTNNLRDAFDLLILSSKYVYNAIGIPNNGYLIDKAQTSANESRDKSKLSINSSLESIKNFELIKKEYQNKLEEMSCDK